MKKGIIVLLIAVLAIGSAFAGFSGNAKIGFDYNLDTKENGFFNSQSMKYGFEFKLDEAVGGSAGEGDIYAEIGAKANFSIKADKVEVDGKEISPVVKLEINKANIVAGDITINILGPKGAFDYAGSYNKDSKGGYIHSFANNYKAGAPGFVASYKGNSLAFAYRHYEQEAVPASGTFKLNTKTGAIEAVDDAKPARNELVLYTGLETQAFALADGLTMQASGNFKLTKADAADKATTRFGAGIKTAYKNEDAKLNVTVAADAEYSAEKLPVDIALTATYDFITAKVYFGTTDKFANGTNLLSGVVSVAKTVDAITLSASAETRHVFNLAHPVFLASAKAEYEADEFSAYCGAKASLQYDSDAYGFKAYKREEAKIADPGLGLSAGISSKALINNATVALDWTGSDFVKSGKKLGTIAASVKVEF